MQSIINVIRIGDIKTFFFLNKTIKNPITDRMMPVITIVGSAVCSIIITIITLLVGTQWKQIGIYLGISHLISHFIVQLGKRFLRRPRPYQSLPGVLTCSKLCKDASFPSGHSTASFCTATVLANAFPSFLFVFYLAASIVAISRIYLGMHYPSDVIVGAALGVITALFVIII